MGHVQDIADRVRQHHKEYPRHGFDCSCMDHEIRELKKILQPFLPSLNEQIEGHKRGDKTTDSLHYVLYHASKRRDY